MKLTFRRFFSLFALTAAAVFCGMGSVVPVHASDGHAVLGGSGVTVYFPQFLQGAAEEVSGFYPETRAAAEKVFGWDMDQDVSIVLVGESSSFELSAGTSEVVAFAVPARSLMVIDYWRLKSHPFTLRSVVMHELFHLLLHRHIPEGGLPLWFEEGVCQWASDGLGEIISGGGGVLDFAVIRGDLLPFRFIERSFPRDPVEMRLAYEQSKSVVVYLVDTYGRDALVEILNSMKNGKNFDAALEDVLGISVRRLEEEWRGSLAGSALWLRFIGHHFYGLLFAFAAVLSIAGFMRVILRKRKAFREYEDEEAE
jgi:hypothetical protein